MIVRWKRIASLSVTIYLSSITIFIITIHRFFSYAIERVMPLHFVYLASMFIQRVLILLIEGIYKDKYIFYPTKCREFMCVCNVSKTQRSRVIVTSNGCCTTIRNKHL